MKGNSFLLVLITTRLVQVLSKFVPSQPNCRVPWLAVMYCSRDSVKDTCAQATHLPQRVCYSHGHWHMQAILASRLRRTPVHLCEGRKLAAGVGTVRAVKHELPAQLLCQRHVEPPRAPATHWQAHTHHQVVGGSWAGHLGEPGGKPLGTLRYEERRLGRLACAAKDIPRLPMPRSFGPYAYRLGSAVDSYSEHSG